MPQVPYNGGPFDGYVHPQGEPLQHQFMKVVEDEKNGSQHLYGFKSTGMNKGSYEYIGLLVPAPEIGELHQVMDDLAAGRLVPREVKVDHSEMTPLRLAIDAVDEETAITILRGMIASRRIEMRKSEDLAIRKNAERAGAALGVPPEKIIEDVKSMRDETEARRAIESMREKLQPKLETYTPKFTFPIEDFVEPEQQSEEP